MINDNGKGIPSSVGGGDWGSGMLDSSLGMTEFASNDGVRQADFDGVMNALYGDTSQSPSATGEQQNKNPKGNSGCAWKKVFSFLLKPLQLIFRKLLQLNKERR